jgi:hypothetical protein
MVKDRDTPIRSHDDLYSTDVNTGLTELLFIHQLSSIMYLQEFKGFVFGVSFDFFF